MTAMLLQDKQKNIYSRNMSYFINSPFIISDLANPSDFLQNLLAFAGH